MRLIVKFALIAALATSPWLMPHPKGALASEPEQEKTKPVFSPAQRLEQGQKLASKKCASCHSIKRTGDSPNKAAPPFRTFADKWPLESLEESLAEGIVTGHAEMPEFVLTPPEIDAFLTFLGSLQKDQ
ncbi:MAG: cytochrome c [Hyphomicrobiaceae bacterium]|nr:cytochrome c [Hyphomicrobiaceae bacterium]